MPSFAKATIGAVLGISYHVRVAVAIDLPLPVYLYTQDTSTQDATAGNKTEFCILVKTGSKGSNSGSLDVRVNSGDGYSSVTRAKRASFYEASEVVLDQCFSNIVGVQVNNPSIYGWAGSVLFSTDQKETYSPFVCNNCNGTIGLSDPIAVDGDDGGSGKSTAQCLNGAWCMLTTSALSNGTTPDGPTEKPSEKPTDLTSDAPSKKPTVEPPSAVTTDPTPSETTSAPTTGEPTYSSSAPDPTVMAAATSSATTSTAASSTAASFITSSTTSVTSSATVSDTTSATTPSYPQTIDLSMYGYPHAQDTADGWLSWPPQTNIDKVEQVFNAKDGFFSPEGCASKCQEIGALSGAWSGEYETCWCNMDRPTGLCKEPCVRDRHVDFSTYPIAELVYCEKSICDEDWFYNEKYCTGVGFDVDNCAAKIEILEDKFPIGTSDQPADVTAGDGGDASGTADPADGGSNVSTSTTTPPNGFGLGTIVEPSSAFTVALYVCYLCSFCVAIALSLIPW